MGRGFLSAGRLGRVDLWGHLMHIFETKTAPNARRVRMFLAEKGLLESIEFVQLDLLAGDNLSLAYRKKNPTAKIPTLELDDGTTIGESVAICRYFEALHPELPLMGVTPLAQAKIEMWQRRAEFYSKTECYRCQPLAKRVVSKHWRLWTCLMSTWPTLLI